MNEKIFDFGPDEMARLRELWVPGAVARDVAQALSDEFGGALSRQHFEAVLAMDGLPATQTPDAEAEPAAPAAPVAHKLGKAPDAPVVPPVDGAAQ